MDVSFYVLESHDIKEYYKTIIQLVVRSYESDHKVAIYSNHDNLLKTLDEYLWTFSPASFIPHTLIKNSDEIDDIDSILLANFLSDEIPKDILFQLGDDVPMGFNQYNRIIEIMYQQSYVLAKGRERFKFYKQNNIDAKMIKL